MKNAFLKIFIILLLLSNNSFASSNKTAKVRVTKVIDGDTFEIELDDQDVFAGLRVSVRVYGIDTPEKGGKAKCKRENDLSIRATEETTKFLKSSNNLITLSKIKWDKFGGRVDAEVFANNKSLGDYLLSKGLARPYYGKKKESWCN